MHHRTQKYLVRAKMRGSGWESFIPGAIQLAAPLLERGINALFPSSSKKKEGDGRRKRRGRHYRRKRGKGVIAPVNAISAGPPV